MIEANSVAGEIFLAKKLADLRVDSLEALPVSLRRQIRKEKLKIDLAHVFGESVQFDEQGSPIEHGLGSPTNQTTHSIAAFKSSHDCNEKRRKAAALKEQDELDELEEMRREAGKLE
jgi:hypothetical protein